MNTKRVFVAIDLSAEAVKAAALHIDRLRRQVPQVRARWIRPQNLHVTLRFVGNVGPNELVVLEERVANVAANFPAPTVTLEKTGAFIRRRSRSNVLWLGISSRSDDARRDVLEEIMGELSGDMGSPAHARHPHLTIARLSDANAARDLVKQHLDSEFGPVAFRADEIVVYESELTPKGSIYTAISRHRLLL